MEKRKITKKVFVLLMILCMAVTYMPSFAFALDAEDAAETETAAEQNETETKLEPKAKAKAMELEAEPGEASQEDESAEAAEAADETASEDTSDKAAKETSEEAEKEVTEAEEESQAEDTAEDPALDEESAEDEEAEKDALPDVSFKPEQSDYLSYDPLYIARYANRDYISANEIDMNCFIDIVSAAKGIASYTYDKDKSLDEDTFIAGLNYEIPIYDIDEDSKYYVAIPNVNKFDGNNFQAFGLTVAYNNDYGEVIKGWKYEKGILYIPKSAVDKPKNDEDVPDGIPIAIQLNYAVGADMNLEKDVHYQVLKKDEPKSGAIHVENIFDESSLVIPTGVKGRKASEISVFLNGQMIPIFDDSWNYDSSTGKIAIQALPGVVSNINVVFEQQTTTEKVATAAKVAVSALTSNAEAATTSSMSYFTLENGQKGTLVFDTSKMFVGWRGYYSSKVKHGNSTVVPNASDYDNYENSAKQVYGAKVTHSGADIEDASDNELDQWYAALWAIQSYAVAYDVRANRDADAGKLYWDEGVKHYLLDSTTQKTYTIYEWLMLYRNTLEKTNGKLIGNGIGGSSNFIFHLPIGKTVEGSDRALAHPDGTPLDNPNIKFTSTNMTSSLWFAGSCSELANAAESDDDGAVYVTCLELTSEYVVLAFVYPTSNQNMTAIYKFKIGGGYLTFKKAATRENYSHPELYTIAGAKYTAYTNSACTTVATDLKGNNITFTILANGNASETYFVEEGTYYIKETTAATNYALDTTVYPVTVSASSNSTAATAAYSTSKDVPDSGFITLVKKSVATYTNFPNSAPNNYSLEGAVYYVYTDSSLTTRARDISGNYVVLTTKADGTTNTAQVDIGDYWVKEYSASEGHMLDENVYSCTVTKNHTSTSPYTFKSSEYPQYTPFSLQKIDYETEKAVPMGGASFKNAEFTLKYYDGSTLKATWVIKTDANGYADLTDDYFVSGSARYKNSDGEYVVPLGKLTVQETKAPEGYTLNNSVYTISIGWDGEKTTKEITTTVTGSGVDRAVLKLNTLKLSFPDRVIRGNYKFVKKAEGEETLYHVPFVIKSATTGEAHVVVADQDGLVATIQENPFTNPADPGLNARKHSFRTNQNDIVIDENGKAVLTDGEHVDLDALLSNYTYPEYIGVWFEKDKQGNVARDINDNLGALPYDTYYITELPVEDNDGYSLFQNIAFKITEDGVLADGGTRTNRKVFITTKALDSISRSQYGTRAERVSLTDTVSYNNVLVGEKYIVKTEAHYAKKVGTSYVDGGLVTDANGNYIKGEAAFTPTREYGEVVVSLNTFDSTKLYVDGEEIQDATIVLFDRLYRIDGSDEIEEVVHEDPEDEDQRVTYPWVGTEIADSKTGIRLTQAGEDTELIDTVTYYNLIPYYTYTFRATLYDQETGQVLRDANGNVVRIVDDRYIRKANGTIDLIYRFDSSEMEGKTITSFLEVYGGNQPTLLDNEDLTDENETIHIPKIRTKASDKETEDEVGKVVGTFKDVVTYENLIPGYTYQMNTDLMYQDTEESTGMTGKKIFTVTANEDDEYRCDGEVEVEFDLSDELTKAMLEGRTLVAFEECLVKAKTGGAAPTSDTVVAEHKDISETDQTVWYPKVRTAAIDTEADEEIGTDDHVGTVRTKATVIDAIEYWNLVEGKEYTFEGQLVDKDTGDVLASDTDTFTATSEDVEHNTRKMVFSIDSSELSGHTLVVYQKLYHNDVEVTQHDDPFDTEEDEELQSVHYPSIATTAVDAETGDHVGSIFGRLINAFRRIVLGEVIADDKTAVVVDTVSLTNLVPSEEYIVRGTLMNKETQEAVTDENGDVITAETTLKANDHEADETVELRFPVDSSTYQNYTMVCFEKLIHANAEDKGEVEVNRHEDFDDEGQSVHNVEMSTVASDSHTDDHVGYTLGNTDIVDAVEMKNLVDGMEYTLVATLRDFDTGEEVKDASGKTYTAELTFTANGETETSDGDRVDETKTVTIKDVDGTALENKTVVVYETLYHNGVAISAHDVTDEAVRETEAVHFPLVETEAYDSKTKDHVGTVSESEDFVDTVKLYNLIPGQEYKVTGKLMLFGTDEPALDADGNEIERSITFTAETRDEVRTITFDGIDTSIWKDQTIVAFEKLEHPNASTGDLVEVANHNESEDESESVHYPDVKTHAIDENSGGHVGSIRETVQVKDKLELRNLIPGMEYTVKGTLYFQNDVTDVSGNVIHKKGDVVQYNGEDVTSEISFTAEEADEFDHVLTFTLDSSVLESATVVAFEKLYHPENNVGTLVEVVQHEDIDDEEQSVHYPRIGTIATDGLTADHVGATEENKIKDVVKYENLIVGQKYLIRGTVMDKKTGEAIVINGSTVTSDTGWFTADEVSGEKEIIFDIDASELDGETVVVFEKLFTPQETDWDDEDKDPIVEVELTNHEDIDDEGQSVHYPKVSTLARDADTDDHIGKVSKDENDTAQVKDTVSLENLIPGQQYTVRGTLMKFGTTQPVTDADGNKITAEKTVTADSENMTVELVFSEYDSSLVRGETTVCFEYLYHANAETGDDVEVATHEVPDEEAQSVHYPKIWTNAVDSETGDHVGSIFGRLINLFRRALGEDVSDDRKAEIIDTVSYVNLIPGETYTFSGTLMDKETGEAVKDASGNAVTAEASMKATKADGETQIHFSVDTSLVQNSVIVCFEKLYHENPETGDKVEVDRHEDIDDADQSVHEAEIETTAKDVNTGNHIGMASGETTITDAVVMRGLLEGAEYTVKGTLYDKSTGEPVLDSAGAPYTDTKTFTADAAEMTIDLTFVVDGKAAEGITAVAFEELYHNDVKISVHSDINDEDQSIHFPKIRTTLTDALTGDHVAMEDDAVVVNDVVKYENLIADKECTIKGVLINKATGEAVTSTDGTPVTAEKTFTPENPDGEETLTFTLEMLPEDTVVAFEELYYPVETEQTDEETGEVTTTTEELLIAYHKDINDKAQTVHAPLVYTSAKLKSKKVTDTVYVKNIIPGRTYVIKGWLVEKKTGKVVKGSANEKRFSIADSDASNIDGNMTVDLKLKDSFSGKAVAFEELYIVETVDGTEKEVLIGEHKDIDDKAQTVDVPKAPKTGDDHLIFLLSAAFIAAAALALVLRKLRDAKQE